MSISAASMAVPPSRQSGITRSAAVWIHEEDVDVAMAMHVNMGYG